MPDFTNCDQTTPEYNRDYKAVIRDGGPERGFSQIMPSFRDALTSEQMDMVIETLRGFCKETGWPRGEMNFPRALMTEKAFPEDETVITTGMNVQGAPGVTNEFVFEKRTARTKSTGSGDPFSFDHSGTGLAWRRRRPRRRLEAGCLSRTCTAALFWACKGKWRCPPATFARVWNRHHHIRNVRCLWASAAGNSFLQVQGGAALPVNTGRRRNRCFADGAGQELQR